MAQVWAENGEGEPMPASLLPMYHGSWLPSSQTSKIQPHFLIGSMVFNHFPIKIVAET